MISVPGGTDDIGVKPMISLLRKGDIFAYSKGVGSRKRLELYKFKWKIM